MKKLLFVDIHGTLLYYPREVKERSDTMPILSDREYCLTVRAGW